jgi:selenocysteine lyase/cysteine desulfurase
LPDHGLASVADLFPATRGDTAFLAHCTVSPLPQPVADAITAQVARASLVGATEDRAARVQGFRDRAAALLHAEPDEIAFVGNTVEGVVLVADGMRWQPGDNIVGGAIEFPANVYPWMALRDRGVELRLVDAREGRITVEAIRAAIDARTQLVALSSVQFLSGHRTDLVRIAELCREREIRLFVDAIQSVGALDLDLRAIPIDYLATAGHKWLLAPTGTGIFYCRRDAELAIPLPGHKSMVPRTDHLPYVFDIRRDAARFERGAQNILGICALEASLGLLLQVGIARIEARVLALTAIVIEGLRARGYEILSPLDERSGIVAFRSSHHDTAQVAATLKNTGVIVSPTQGWVRAAPHFYNSEDDIQRLLRGLP